MLRSLRALCGAFIKATIGLVFSLLASLLFCSLFLGYLPMAYAQVCTATNPTPGTPACGAAAGNPLNVMSGNKFQREVDMPALPGVLGLELVRYYNSEAALAQEKSIMGRGWRLSYDAELLVYSGGHSVIVYQGDGTQSRYHRSLYQPERDQGITLFNGSRHGQGTLRLHRPHNGSTRGMEYILRPGGSNANEQSFDENGKLVRITAPSGEYVSMQRDLDGFLLRVTDPQGRYLALRHLPRRLAQAGDRFAGVQYIDSPVGRFDYSYGSALPKASAAQPGETIANLVKVSLPTHYDPDTPASEGSERGTTRSKVSRLYHYENAQRPTLLTGISVQGQGSDDRAMNQRIVTWGYDARGRANQSVKGVFDPKTPGVEQVNLEFTVNGSTGGGTTLLTNSLGQTTTYAYAQIEGQPRLLEVRGAGCATCGPVNLQNRYDDKGRQTQEIKLDHQGQPVEAEITTYDGIDRPTSVSTVRYLNGKAGAQQLKERYQYGGNLLGNLPTLIARPSVIAGQEHIVRVQYNDKGQPLTVTESGFSPIDEQGQSATAGAAISRTLRYRYALINGRSVLVQVDGALPNGPKGTPEDSDITRYEWDRQGSFVTAVENPLRLRQTLRQDRDTGRLVEEAAVDGITTHTSYEGAGQLARTERAGVVIVRLYDALGRLSGMADGAGRKISLDHDSADRLVRVSDAQGYASGFSLDTEGKLLVSGLYEPGQGEPGQGSGTSAAPLRATYRWYDADQRLAKQLRADGRLDTYTYDEQGRVIAHTDGDDVLHLVRENKFGTFSARFELTPDGLIRAGLRPRFDQPAVRNELRNELRDDFGRRVAYILPDHGGRIAIYNEANQLTRLTDTAGVVSDYQYDAAGRLGLKTTRLESAGAGPSAPGQTPSAQVVTAETVTLHYEGARLARVEDAAQITAYAWDAAGRLAQSTVTLLDAQGRKVTSYTTATRYDERTGLALTRQLADGQVLQVRRNPATQVAERLDLQGPWAARLSAFIAERLPGWMQWLQRAVPRTVVLQDIRFHPFNGIAGHTGGDGITEARTFDTAGRLTRLTAGAAAGRLFELGLRYDVGPRIREATSQDAQGKLTRVDYRYDGFGMLQAQGAAKAGVLRTRLGSSTGPAAIAALVPAAAGAAGATPARRDRLGRTLNDGRHRYTYTSANQLETARDEAGQLLASYRYNSNAQRVSKTVYAPGREPATTYFLWQGNQLVAEVNAQGRITSQYLYLSEEGRAAPVAKLESAANEDNASHAERILYIHTDHRGAPVAMTDAARKVLWQASLTPWGQAALGVSEARLNLRLPGQYFDEETGLHDNFHRTYDPKEGRYLQPDPLGYPDGPDAYLYAGGDPINKIDPLGLYQEDIHYYMSYFLAVMAGLPEKEALVVALGAQYVDDNPFTWPLDSNNTVWSYITGPVSATNRLAAYHFTQAGQDVSRIEKWYVPTDAERVAAINAGNPPLPPYISEPDDIYAARRIKNPQNPQLGNLLAASTNAPARCAKLQLFGEYLHAFEDTFGHRNKSNEPIDVNAGLGHAVYGEQPDYTYNDTVYLTLFPGAVGNWDMREARTLEMESEAFAKIRATFGTQAKDASGRPISSADIEATLKKFNSLQELENDGSNFAGKLKVLNAALTQFQFKPFDENLRYNVTSACTNRQNNLKSIVALGSDSARSQYPGVILGAPQQCPDIRGQTTK
jgi:RHS repeat-associated protein